MVTEAARVAVGLSGGVDSAVAALLLKREGYSVTGVTMTLWREGRYGGGCGDACFGPGEKEDVETARRVAAMLGIPYETFDCSAEYERDVIEYFRRERIAGRTPNPCIVCNSTMKFGLLPRKALAAGGFDFFATGHYARKAAMPGGRFAAAVAADTKKDQSYFLCRLSQEQLAKALFPLGAYTKAQVRQIARDAGLPVADKPDSQDFYSGDENELIGVEPREGDIVDLSGKVLGRHGGYWRYTIGQRQGLGVGGGVPYHVVRIDACANRVVVGRREDVLSTRIELEDVVWQAMEPAASRIEGLLKIRSTGAPAGPAFYENGAIDVPGGVFGVSPGQSAVLYSATGEIVLAGTIVR